MASLRTSLGDKLKVRNQLTKECFAEFLGTLTLLVKQCYNVLQVMLWDLGP